MNIVEIVSIMNREAFSQKLPFLTNLYGFRCEIFRPLTIDSHYQNSSKIIYNSSPDETRQVLVTNQFALLQKGNNVYDPFNPIDVEAIVSYKNPFLDNSKIKVYKGDSFVEYRVDINSTLVTGTNNKPLYYRYKLIPVI